MDKHKVSAGMLASMPKKHEEDEGEYKEMPEHVKKMAHGGYACLSCGGKVGEDGYSNDDGSEGITESGYEFNDDDTDDEPEQGLNVEHAFARAVKGRR